MKTIKKITGLVILILFFAPLTQVMAQPGAPPADKNGTEGGTPIGGDAPIGGGLIILGTLGLAYGGKKIYDLRKKQKEEE